MDNLELYIESLIFATGQAITLKELKTTINEHFKTSIKDKEIKETLDRLSDKYTDDKYPFEIMEIAGGYQFMTKGTYYPIISQQLRLESKKKLSKAALECLALVAYKQPLTKSGVESVRGVNCDHSIQKLLDQELIQITGRAEGPGRPLLYGTTHKFMDHFGLKSLNDLPKIKEFELPENEVGIHSDDLPDPSQSADLEEIPVDNDPKASKIEPVVNREENQEEDLLTMTNEEISQNNEDLSPEELMLEQEDEEPTNRNEKVEGSNEYDDQVQNEDTLEVEIAEEEEEEKNIGQQVVDEMNREMGLPQVQSPKSENPNEQSEPEISNSGSEPNSLNTVIEPTEVSQTEKSSLRLISEEEE